jgi:two-component system, chemotaxis family, chemotaxis protein CheY
MAKTILTVDDSASMRQMIKLTLSGAGYDVTEANDGAQGLATARTKAFDMVLTDLNMPGMDGVSMIKEIRKLQTYTGIPIVLLTTESDAEKKAQAKAAGATGWITKPFKPEQLLAVVAKLVRA